MKQAITWQGPVKPYVWGATFEIRDNVNRTVIRAQVLKGDVTYRKNMEKLMHTLAALMNGKSWIEIASNGPRLLSLGVPVENVPSPQIIEEIVKDANVVAVAHDPEPISSSVEEELEGEAQLNVEVPQEILEHQRRKPGRPKKSK